MIVRDMRNSRLKKSSAARMERTGTRSQEHSRASAREDSETLAAIK